RNKEVKGRRKGATGTTQKADRREERRKRAWKLKEDGWSQQDIAAALGVSEGAVSQWIKRAREGGMAALQAHPPKGVSPRLTAEQKPTGFAGMCGQRVEWPK